LPQAAGQAFYKTSKFTLRDLKARASQQQLRADFEAYLDGFSPNVQDILENFEFRNQIPRLSKADALGTLIEKLLSHARRDPRRHRRAGERDRRIARRDHRQECERMSAKRLARAQGTEALTHSEALLAEVRGLILEARRSQDLDSGASTQIS
jgi:hypothetical protein